MRYYAKIENGVVKDIISASSLSWCKNSHDAQWVCITQEDVPRVCIGHTYDGSNFYAPQPFPSWTLDKSYEWVPPVTMPVKGRYYWDEKKQSWIKITV